MKKVKIYEGLRRMKDFSILVPCSGRPGIEQASGSGSGSRRHGCCRQPTTRIVRPPNDQYLVNEASWVAIRGVFIKAFRFLITPLLCRLYCRFEPIVPAERAGSIVWGGTRRGYYHIKLKCLGDIAANGTFAM